MNVISASDTRYLPGLLVTWASILKTSSRDPIHFYLLYDGVPEAEIDSFKERLGKVSNRFYLHEISLDTKQFEGFPDFFYDSNMPYARLLIPDLVPVDRAIYIDCDFLCLKDLETIWKIDMKSNPIGAVEEWDYNGEEDIQLLVHQFPNIIGHRYFNSGLLLMDLETIRKENLFQACLDLLLNEKRKCKWWDQTALNAVFAGRCQYLDPNLNYQLKPGRYFNGEDLHLLRDKSLNLHYVTGNKPWIRPDCSLPHRLFLLFQDSIFGHPLTDSTAIKKSPLRMALLKNELSLLRLQFLSLASTRNSTDYKRLADQHRELGQNLRIDLQHHQEIVNVLKYWIQSLSPNGH